MAISYDGLWILLIKKKLKKTDLKRISGISSNVLAKLGKNEPVSIESLEKICLSLDCKIQDIFEITGGPSDD